jgi:ABC-type Na+ efflux pump permease subunit
MDELCANLRVIWAIAAKDIVDALKNRNTLSNIIATFFIVFFYKLLPPLIESGGVPNLLVYDAGGSSLGAALGSSAAVDTYLYPSQAVMEEKLSNGNYPELGLVIPAEFDQALEQGDDLELEGYVSYWVSDGDAEELRAVVEDEIATLVGRPVHINLRGNVVYDDQPGLGGVSFLAAIALLLVVVLGGVVIVPHLMIEEKATKTIDVLRVSPASSGQLVMGKALAGLFYCLTISVTVFALNSAVIIHWGLAFLVTVLGGLFSVALGLLLGSLLEVRQQMMTWGFMLLNVLLIPVFLAAMTEILPGWLGTIVLWVPTAVLARSFERACLHRITWMEVGPGLAYATGWTVLILAAVAWTVRRLDRKGA